MEVCKIDGCGRKQKRSARGYCDTHYRRFLAVRDEALVAAPVAPRGTRSTFFSQALASTQDGCILWPFSTNKAGYGQYCIDGRAINAHRAMCIAKHGNPPFDGAQAAHICGVASCINPRHLRWATTLENHADKKIHGTTPRGERQGRARFTNEQAASILDDKRTATAIAAEFGVCREVISRIRRGETYTEAAALHLTLKQQFADRVWIPGSGR